MNKVLITGGTGLVGSELSSSLKEKGYEVIHLSRTENLNAEFKAYKWNIKEGYIDPKALIGISHIIHLAGANISGGRWTDQRKKVIIESRTLSTSLLLSEVKKHNLQLASFISASATGYYGAVTDEKIYSETDSPAFDFLGEVCRKWEEEIFKFRELGSRTAVLRTGVVLTLKGGALKKLITPVKLGIGTPVGSGEQYMPWIHIKDLCNMYIHALENETINGAYNAISSEHVTNKEFTKKLAKTVRRPFWPIPVPSFMIKLLFGEMSKIILEGSRVSNEKIKSTGFKFKFTEVKSSLEDLCQ